MKTSLQRIIRGGWTNFTRNGVVSMASVLVMTITLFVITSLIFLQAILFSSLTQIKDKVDITIYFNLNAPESKILTLKDALEKQAEVSSVTYVTAEDALKNFQTRHANDFLILQALDELDQNPLSAYVNVKAKEASQYEGIVKFLEGDSALAKDSSSIIEKINYNQNKTIIDRLVALIDGSKKIGMGVTAFLVLISIIITFNTIRLTIYISREEIGIMKLVGASSKYVRGPFLVEGAIYGIFATLIVTAIFFPATLWMGNNMTSFLGLNLYEYFLSNFFQIFGIALLSGVLLGMISSGMAVSRYISK